MANPNAIVGLISRIEPPVTRSGVEMFRQFRDVFSVEIEGERAARLYPSEEAAGQLEILEGLRALGTPVFTWNSIRAPRQLLDCLFR